MSCDAPVWRSDPLMPRSPHAWVIDRVEARAIDTIYAMDAAVFAARATVNEKISTTVRNISDKAPDLARPAAAAGQLASIGTRNVLASDFLFPNALRWAQRKVHRKE